MTIKEDDIVWVNFLDHSMNFGNLIEVDLIGFVEKIDDESITVTCWKSKNVEAQNESFTLGWGMINYCWKIKVD